MNLNNLAQHIKNINIKEVLNKMVEAIYNFSLRLGAISCLIILLGLMGLGDFVELQDAFGPIISGGVLCVFSLAMIELSFWLDEKLNK